MGTKESEKNSNDAPRDPALSRIYRAGATDVPPPAIDAKILAEARRAVETPRSHARTLARWAVPLSIAATVVLSVSIVLRMSSDGTPDSGFARAIPETVPPPAPATDLPAPTPSETLSQTRERRAVPAPAARAPELKKLQEAARKATSKGSRNAGADNVTPSSERSFAAASAPPATSGKADVTAVRISGMPGAYQFSVTLRSPDTGCAQYADSWEIVSADGRLLYRRVLLHSHADEQPFERSGGPVAIEADATVWVRAHMSAAGHGGVAFKGSARDGFARAPLAPEFAAALATQPPLPDGCAF